MEKITMKPHTKAFILIATIYVFAYAVKGIVKFFSFESNELFRKLSKCELDCRKSKVTQKLLSFINICCITDRRGRLFFANVCPIFWSPVFNKLASMILKQFLVERFGRKSDLDQIIAGMQLRQPLMKHSFNSQLVNIEVLRYLFSVFYRQSFHFWFQRFQPTKKMEGLAEAAISNLFKTNSPT